MASEVLFLLLYNVSIHVEAKEMKNLGHSLIFSMKLWS